MIKVLIIDDEQSVCRTFKRLLEQRGISTDTATSCNEADPLVNTTSYAVIAVDYRMPETTGFELISRYRSRQPNATFLMFSGEFDKHLDVPSNQGSFWFIPKAGDPEIFADCIERGIRQFEQCVAAQDEKDQTTDPAHRVSRRSSTVSDELEEPPPEHRYAVCEVGARTTQSGRKR